VLVSDARVPVAVDVDRAGGVHLAWEDEPATDVDLETLRQRCPCAECRNRREHGEAVWPTASSPRPLRIDDAEIVGGYGLSVTWNDGHRTGIYSWELLRSL
jgi:DUF971 family protein